MEIQFIYSYLIICIRVSDNLQKGILSYFNINIIQIIYFISFNVRYSLSSSLFLLNKDLLISEYVSSSLNITFSELIDFFIVKYFGIIHTVPDKSEAMY